jgi:lipopolysaccharide heptosyltransferase I
MTLPKSADDLRILCIRLSGLGDVVHALNALSLLRQERPHARIAWIVEDRFAGLLHGHPHLDCVVEIPRRRWDPMFRNPLRWPELWNEGRPMAGRLRRERFDVSLDFQSSIKSSWIARDAGAPLRIGFDRPVSRELSRIFQNTLVRVPMNGIHRIERDLALLQPLGITPRYTSPALPRNDTIRKRLQETLRPMLDGGPVVMIHPGTSSFAEFKRWPPDRYARVAADLVRKRRADVFVTHGPGERKLASQVAETAGARVELAPSTCSIQELVELLRLADLFIGSDTGPMHLASALHVPVVALFGPKDAEQTGPYCSRSIVVEGDSDCRPCELRYCNHVRCMTSIDVGAVLEAALAVLDGEGELPYEVRAQKGVAI